MSSAHLSIASHAVQGLATLLQWFRRRKTNVPIESMSHGGAGGRVCGDSPDSWLSLSRNENICTRLACRKQHVFRLKVIRRQLQPRCQHESEAGLNRCCPCDCCDRTRVVWLVTSRRGQDASGEAEKRGKILCMQIESIAGETRTERERETKGWGIRLQAAAATCLQRSPVSPVLVSSALLLQPLSRATAVASVIRA